MTAALIYKAHSTQGDWWKDRGGLPLNIYPIVPSTSSYIEWVLGFFLTSTHPRISLLYHISFPFYGYFQSNICVRLSFCLLILWLMTSVKPVTRALDIFTIKKLLSVFKVELIFRLMTQLTNTAITQILDVLFSEC